MSSRPLVLGSLLSLPLTACVIPATGPGPYVAGEAPAQRTPGDVVDHRAPDAPPNDIAVGEPVDDPAALRFARPGTWTLYGNGPAALQTDGDQLTLIADDAYSAAAAAFWTGEARAPYTLELDYQTWDDDGGGDLTRSGDGIAVMLFKSEDPYRDGMALPAGGGRGVIRDGTGYAIELPLYGNRQVLLSDGEGRVLAAEPLAAAYTGARFAHLRIDVDDDGIAVAVDGNPVLAWRGRVHRRHGGIAIAAGTGAADAAHIVGNVRLTADSFDPGDDDRGRGRNLVENGDFELPRLGEGAWSSQAAIPGWRTVAGPGLELQRRAAGSPARGDQLVELDGDGASAMAQDVATRPGATYRLRYRFAARPGTARDDNRLRVRWNGQIVDEVEADGASGDTRWIERTVTVRADGPVGRLVFEDGGVSNGLGTYVDDVSLRERRR
jgi:hypothetical protein